MRLWLSILRCKTCHLSYFVGFFIIIIVAAVAVVVVVVVVVAVLC
jgi:hypothetical protein